MAAAAKTIHRHLAFQWVHTEWSLTWLKQLKCKCSTFSFACNHTLVNTQIYTSTRSIDRAFDYFSLFFLLGLSCLNFRYLSVSLFRTKKRYRCVLTDSQYWTYFLINSIFLYLQFIYLISYRILRDNRTQRVIRTQNAHTKSEECVLFVFILWWWWWWCWWLTFLTQTSCHDNSWLSDCGCVLWRCVHCTHFTHFDFVSGFFRHGQYREKWKNWGNFSAATADSVLVHMYWFSCVNII